MFQGKLTYASVIVLALSAIAAKRGIPATPDDIASVLAQIGTVAGTVGGIYGRWRATRAKA